MTFVDTYFRGFFSVSVEIYIESECLIVITFSGWIFSVVTFKYLLII